jgi:hypothetical protein
MKSEEYFDINTHCCNILKYREIRNKVLVLCEGSCSKDLTKRNLDIYKNSIEFEDAKFYSKCIPDNWNYPKPVFINCGDKFNTLKTYEKLIELTKSKNFNLEKSYKPKETFALVDLDIQNTNIENYQFRNTEEIYLNLYKELKVNIKTYSTHFIWTTGLIHKEAYFLITYIENVIEKNKLNFNGRILTNNDLYKIIIEDCLNDKDLKDNFNRIINRIEFNNKLSFLSISDFVNSFIKEFETKKHNYKSELKKILFTISKIKPYWEKIKPLKHDTRSEKDFLEQTKLQIAKFYKNPELQSPENHIPFFFKFLMENSGN